MEYMPAALQKVLLKRHFQICRSRSASGIQTMNGEKYENLLIENRTGKNIRMGA